MKLTAITFMVVALCANGIEAGTLALRSKELLNKRAEEKIGRTSTTTDDEEQTGSWCGSYCKKVACNSGCIKMYFADKGDFADDKFAAADGDHFLGDYDRFADRCQRMCASDVNYTRTRKLHTGFWCGSQCKENFCINGCDNMMYMYTSDTRLDWKLGGLEGLGWFPGYNATRCPDQYDWRCTGTLSRSDVNSHHNGYTHDMVLADDDCKKQCGWDYNKEKHTAEKIRALFAEDGF